MVLYKELNKQSTDLLTKDYVHERPFGIEFKNNSKGATFTYGARSQRKSSSSDTPIEADAIAKFHSPSTKSTLEVQFGNKSSDVEFTSLIPETFLPELQLGAKFTRSEHQSKDGTARPDSLTLSLEQQVKPMNAHWRLQCNPLKESWSANLLKVYPRTRYGTLRIGGEAGGKSDIFSCDTWKAGSDNALKNTYCSVGAALCNESRGGLLWAASLKGVFRHRLGKDLSSVNVNVHSKDALRPYAPEYAAEVAYTPANNHTSVAVATKIWLPSTAGRFACYPSPSSLQLRLAHDGKFAGTLNHMIADGWTAAVGAQLDPNSWPSHNALKYGVKLSFDDSALVKLGTAIGTHAANVPTSKIAEAAYPPQRAYSSL